MEAKLRLFSGVKTAQRGVLWTVNWDWDCPAQFTLFTLSLGCKGEAFDADQVYGGGGGGAGGGGGVFWTSRRLSCFLVTD
jgi:hypothetical protein